MQARMAQVNFVPLPSGDIAENLVLHAVWILLEPGDRGAEFSKTFFGGGFAGGHHLGDVGRHLVTDIESLLG